MAKPRIFISSTFYDLKHIRADLDRFIIDIGYEPIRNENGDIPYGSQMELEEYCYKEVKEVDILVGIIGNRYGSDSKDKRHSITQLEIKTAFEQGKQVYIFIDKNVYTEYQTYLANKGSTIKFFYVDNIKVYEFIEEVTNIKAGFIIQPFEHVTDITLYLRSQWAGLFRDFLRHSSENQQLNKLSTKINDLEAISETLKSYIEESLPSLLNDKTDVQQFIKSENDKILQKKIDNRLMNLSYIKHLVDVHGISLDLIEKGLKESNSMMEFVHYIENVDVTGKNLNCMLSMGLNDLIMARNILNRSAFEDDLETARYLDGLNYER